MPQRNAEDADGNEAFNREDTEKHKEQVQFGDERHVKADFFAALREPADVVSARLHVFVPDVAQSSSKNGQPVTVSHQRASWMR